MAAIRLDKYLTQCGIGSRSDVKNIIKKGNVTVNGVKASDPGQKITENDSVLVNGQSLVHETNHYYMLNKPQGVVSATQDNTAGTVIDSLKNENVKGLFPVGRLDKDTEGLLIITDDGALAHDLLSPKKHVDKTYYVVADAQLSEEAVGLIENGIDIGDDDLCLPANISYDHEDEQGYHYYLTITEGRFHQVKRMFKACGSNVTYLKRMSMGSLKLDEKLCSSEYRRLTDEEVEALRRRC